MPFLRLAFYLGFLVMVTTLARADDALSPFGIGSDSARNRSVDAYKAWVPQMEAIGLTVHRTPETSWYAIEPEKGKWMWDNLEAQMDYLTEHHIQFGGIFAGNPQWNTLDAPGNLPVNNLAAWSEYVTQVVRHAHGKIKYWEVWNEPPNGTGRDQTAADYAKIVVSAYDAAKAVDPTCKIGLEAKSVDLNYLEQAIRAGAKDHFDYIVLHPYESIGTVMDHPGTESVFLHIVPIVRKMLAAQDPPKADAPVWFTELGSDAGKDAKIPAYALVKAFAMGIAQDVMCISWFEGMDGDSGPMGLLQGDGTPRPAYKAMEEMIRALGEHPVYLGWVMIHDQDCGFLFQGKSGTVLITWAPKGMTDTIDLGPAASIVDPLTGVATQASSYALTETPVIINGAPDDLVKLAASNKTKPFPWGGDYSDAKSVSVTFGATNIEKGLHTQSAASVAANVVLYGGGARAGNVPGGNVFMVDPNFLSYASTPIEITVVVRRDAANDNAGFGLKYESKRGNETGAGWYSIPEGKEWSTKTWKIDDAQFVSMYGFNFELNSDGNTYNKYEIQSVTVTKLDH